MSRYRNILETIGQTPLVRVEQFERAYQLDNQVYLKLESFNPGNNVKVRPSFQMIKALYDNGQMTKDSIIVEATSGNTGIGLALVGAYYKNKVIIVMPEKVSKERIDIIKHYGAEVILTDPSLGIEGSKQKALELAKNPLVVIPSQFENPNNPLAHYQQTAVELYQDLPSIDYIFVGVGTGGTITGLGRYIDEHHLYTLLIAVEPEESQVLKGDQPSEHGIAGISPGFIPKNYCPGVVDDIEAVSTVNARKMTKEFVPLEAISIGISSGATIQAMLQYIKKHQIKGKTMVCICPDSGDKYFSTKVFD